MRSGLFQFLLLLACVAVMARYAGRGPSPQRLERFLLVVSRDPLSASEGKPPKLRGDSLSLEVTERGWYFVRVSQGEVGSGFRGYWTPAHFESLGKLLEQAGVWQLRDGDGGEPEGQVLYTYLEVSDGQRTSRTFWRGLPRAHRRVAEVLLTRPEMGPYLGLEIDRLARGKRVSPPEGAPLTTPTR